MCLTLDFLRACRSLRELTRIEIALNGKKKPVSDVFIHFPHSPPAANASVIRLFQLKDSVKNV